MIHTCALFRSWLAPNHLTFRRPAAPVASRALRVSRAAWVSPAIPTTGAAITIALKRRREVSARRTSSRRGASAQASPLGPQDVLEFWFGAAPDRSLLSDAAYLKQRTRLWFRGGPGFDAAACAFERTLRAAISGSLTSDAWQKHEGRLAQVILLDQLSRQVWRGTKAAFDGDARAQELAISLLSEGLSRWESAEAMFLLMPLMHSERPEDHDMLQALMSADSADCVARGEEPRLRRQEKDATNHRAVIQRFGRYPHRNALLGRVSTPAESRWLAEEAPGWARSQAVAQTSEHGKELSAAFEQRGRSQPRIRLVSVDCTGTLFDWVASIGAIYRDAVCRALPAEKHAIPQEKVVQAAFEGAMRETMRRWPMFGYQQVSSKDWWKTVVRKTFEECDAQWVRDDAQFSAAFEEIYGTFQTVEPYRLFEDARPFLQWSLRQGLVVVVVSNTTESYRDAVLPALGLGEFVHFGVYSKVDGVEKPGAAFDLMLERGRALVPGLKAGEVLHIGNDPRKDVLGAQAIGMRAFLVDRARGQGLLAARERLERTALRWCEEVCSGEP